MVNGSRQHADTYTDTTSPVASQLQTRIFICVSAFRKYEITQLDLTNAYLHAPIQDVVYIIIPEGFPNAGDVARLRKAAYGTKQGAGGKVKGERVEAVSGGEGRVGLVGADVI